MDLLRTRLRGSSNGELVTGPGPPLRQLQQCFEEIPWKREENLRNGFAKDGWQVKNSKTWERVTQVSITSLDFIRKRRLVWCTKCYQKHSSTFKEAWAIPKRARCWVWRWKPSNERKWHVLCWREDFSNWWRYNGSWLQPKHWQVSYP